MKVRGLLLLSMLIWQMSVSAFIENGLIFSVEDKNATEARVDGFRCYSLDGREMQNNPTKPGIYIVNGRKIILPSIRP